MSRDADTFEGGVARGLIGASMFVCVLGLVAEIANTRDLLPGSLYAFLSLSFEGNLPTWYATCLLAASALGAYVNASIDDSSATNGDCRRWKVLGFVFLFMSLDEAVELHENLGGIIGGSGIFYFDWVLVAAPLVALVGCYFLPLLRRLDESTKRTFVLAGGTYVLGALVLELPLGWWTERAGDDNFVYGLIDWCEESLEVAGLTMFIGALHRRAKCLTGA